MTDSFVLQATSVSKAFDEGAGKVQVLNDISLAVASHEFLAIIGASGSGKSTLLHVLGLLDRPDSGEVLIKNQNTGNLAENERSKMRNQELGFVYQFHHLLAEFSALDNVAMPLIIRGQKRDVARVKAHELLVQVGLEHRIHNAPGQLSGGERQRVAMARALVTEPACVLADEPTGNLDRATADEMFTLFRRLNDDLGTAFIVVTHDQELAALAHRRLLMKDGVLKPD